MQKSTTVDETVIAFRRDIESLLRTRIRQAIQMVLEEELDEALGCGRYERGGSRGGYPTVRSSGASRHPTVPRPWRFHEAVW